MPFHFNYCIAQKYALIDRGWRKPMIFADTVTRDQLRKGWYPVYTNELDTLTKLLGNFATIFKKGMRRTYIDNEDFKTSSIQFKIINVQMAYGDRYDVDMTSITDAANVTMRVSNSQISNHDNQYKIKLFYNYLKKHIAKINK